MVVLIYLWLMKMLLLLVVRRDAAELCMHDVLLCGCSSWNCGCVSRRGTMGAYVVGRRSMGQRVVKRDTMFTVSVCMGRLSAQP